MIMIMIFFFLISTLIDILSDETAFYIVFVLLVCEFQKAS